MTAPVIIDIIAAGILVLFTLLGAKRGLFRALSGLVMILLALAGASLIANTLAAPAARVLAPAVEKRIEARMDEAVRDRTPLLETEEDSELDALLDALGLDSRRRDSLAESAREMIRESGAPILEAVITAAAESVIHGILYILAFFLLMVLLKLIARAMDLVFRLPVLSEANALLGGAAGLIEGTVLLVLAALALSRLGVPLGEAPWNETYFLRIFTAVLR